MQLPLLKRYCLEALRWLSPLALLRVLLVQRRSLWTVRSPIQDRQRTPQTFSSNSAVHEDRIVERFSRNVVDKIFRQQPYDDIIEECQL